jgi:UDPglucose--hexose-1-phosphate uridylyltransferase
MSTVSQAELTILPRGTVLEQDAVQQRLAILYRQCGSIGLVLDELLAWLETIGYFDHLQAGNEYLAFDDPAYHVRTRLQVNYSRLSYKLPDGARRLACPLCRDNVGAPGKELLRVFEFTLAGCEYFAHPTPFPLHRGHFVCNVLHHEPMRIGRPALHESAAFLRGAAGWLVASNSDVEWAGASVLGHHHIQVFNRLALPVEDAVSTCSASHDGTQVNWLAWPCPVIRLSGAHDPVLRTAGLLIERWKASDPARATCNYLMRRHAEELTVHLFLRNSLFRTPESLRHIKAEGVGIIEMAGEVIVPPLADRTRPENRKFFEEAGAHFVSSLIAGNAPPTGDPPDLLANLLR